MNRSRVFLVLFMVAVVLHSILAQTQPKCSSILMTKCTLDAECACLGPSRFICNYKNVCNRISIIDIMRKQQPCRHLYKRYCATDNDCACKGVTYICEDNECVRENRCPSI